MPDWYEGLWGGLDCPCEGADEEEADGPAAPCPATPKKLDGRPTAARSGRDCAGCECGCAAKGRLEFDELAEELAEEDG